MIQARKQTKGGNESKVCHVTGQNFKMKQEITEPQTEPWQEVISILFI